MRKHVRFISSSFFHLPTTHNSHGKDATHSTPFNVPLYLGDLWITLRHSRTNAQPTHLRFTTLKDFDDLIALVTCSAYFYISTKFQLSTNRRMLPDYRNRSESMSLRAYLQIVSPNLCHAYTQFVLKTHPPANRTPQLGLLLSLPSPASTKALLSIS